MKWNRVEDGLPKSGMFVLAYFKTHYGHGRRIRAMHVDKFSFVGDYDGDTDDVLDYSEEDDEYFLSEGWYEQNEHEETHWKVDYPVTHWMDLPLPPGEE